MWILTTTGFFSAVQDKHDPARLMVRSRVRADLEALVQALGVETPILAQAGTDYPFRIFIPRQLFAGWLAEQAQEIDYTNFKAEVYRRQGAQREAVYASVWVRLKALEALPE